MLWGLVSAGRRLRACRTVNTVKTCRDLAEAHRTKSMPSSQSQAITDSLVRSIMGFPATAPILPLFASINLETLFKRNLKG